MIIELRLVSNEKLTHFICVLINFETRFMFLQQSQDDGRKVVNLNQRFKSDWSVRFMCEPDVFH